MPKDKESKVLMDFGRYRESKVAIPDDELEDAIYFFNGKIDDIAVHYGVASSHIIRQIRRNISLNDTYNFVKDTIQDKMFEQANEALADIMNDAEQASARVQASKAVLGFYGKTHGYNKVDGKAADTGKSELELHEELYEEG